MGGWPGRQLPGQDWGAVGRAGRVASNVLGSGILGTLTPVEALSGVCWR